MVTDSEARLRIACNLRRILESRNWTQADLARAVFGTVDHAIRVKVCRWLSGQQAPSAADLANLVEATGESFQQLLAKNDAAMASPGLTQRVLKRITGDMSITSNDKTKWLTMQEAADMLGVSVARAHQLLKTYDVPFKMLNPRMKLVDETRIKELKKMRRPNGVNLSYRE